MLSKQKERTASSSSVKWLPQLVGIGLGLATLVFLFAAPGGAVLPLTFGAALLLGECAPAATYEE